MTATLPTVPEPLSPAESAPVLRTGGIGTWCRRWWRGSESDPRWARPALFALLATTALLYLWNLGANGWANTYYAAAVQAGSRSWKAFFFGSFDASNFITVDKTPLSLWPMALSARVFGLSSWSMLVPQALIGVATVGVLYLTVKRWFGPGAALLAGAICALTPAATLMFRFNNPDAALTLLMTIGAYCVTRAIEQDSTRWMVLAGVAIGLGFLAKEVQAFLVLPAFSAAYLLAGPAGLGRRLWRCVLLGLSTIATSIWWVLIVELWPASSRPYVGGSQHNSFWEIIFGVRGFGRLTSDKAGGIGTISKPQPIAAVWGQTGFTRLFKTTFAGQASWLLPAALILLVAGLLWTARRARTDRTRAGLVLWGTWLVVTGLVISLERIVHEYFTVALAPALGAVIGIGGTLMWTHRDRLVARGVLATTIVATGIWSAELLDRSSDWHPWLHDVVLIGGIALAIILLIPRRWDRLVPATLALTVLIGLLGPAAYSLDTVGTTTGGPIPIAGPVKSSLPGFGGALPRSGLPEIGSFSFDGAFDGSLGAGGQDPSANPPPTAPRGNRSARTSRSDRPKRARDDAPRTPNRNADENRLNSILKRRAGRYRWVAATVGAQAAARYQLGSGAPIMAIGGFLGTDPAPTLAQFRRYVADAEVRYFIGGMGRPSREGRDSTDTVHEWVAANFAPQTIDGQIVYDLSRPTTAGREMG